MHSSNIKPNWFLHVMWLGDFITQVPLAGLDGQVLISGTEDGIPWNTVLVKVVRAGIRTPTNQLLCFKNQLDPFNWYDLFIPTGKTSNPNFIQIWEELMGPNIKINGHIMPRKTKDHNPKQTFIMLHHSNHSHYDSQDHPGGKRQQSALKNSVG